MTMRQELIISAFTLFPYLLAAWGFTALSEGDWSTFWIALLMLFAVRTFFWLIDTVGGILRWRLWGRQSVVTHAMIWFNAYKFPQRLYADDCLGNYLARIEDDPQQPPSIRSAAAELNRMFVVYENLGILMGARFHSAYEIAFERYAPPAKAAKRSVFDEPYFAKEAADTESPQKDPPEIPPTL